MINVINNNCFHMGMIVLMLIILWDKSWINIYVWIWGLIIMYLLYETSSRNQRPKIYSRNSCELKVLQILKIRKEKKEKKCGICVCDFACVCFLFLSFSPLVCWNDPSLHPRVMEPLFCSLTRLLFPCLANVCKHCTGHRRVS